MRFIDEDDLAVCASEPLRWSGHVQSFGALLAVDLKGTLTHASENASVFFDLCGTQADPPTIDELFEDNMEYFGDRERVLHPKTHFAITGVLTNRGITGELTRSLNGTSVIYEFEPRVECPEPRVLADVTTGCAMVRQELADPLRETLMRIHELSGFPKVMVYQFLHDGSGQVVAELGGRTQRSYLGLRFPASDIPTNARELYQSNPYRLIADIDDLPIPIVPIGDEHNALDLTSSTLRSVSPVHLEYLSTMGVKASASFAIRLFGKLWGLVAMHSPHPRVIPLPARLMIRQLLDNRLAPRILDVHVRESNIRHETSAQAFITVAQKLCDSMKGASTALCLDDKERQLINNDGMAVFVNGDLAFVSADELEPHVGELARLGRRSTPELGQFVTATLDPHLPYRSPELREQISGLLYESSGMQSGAKPPRIELLWMRREERQEIRWAGKPEKRRDTIDGALRISPRRSFEEWINLSEGVAVPFSLGDRRVASKILADTLRLHRATMEEEGLP